MVDPTATPQTDTAVEQAPPKPFHWGLGRRKAAVARVKLIPNGSGQITINKKRSLEDYFVREQDRIHLLAPLHLTGTRAKYDLTIRIDGGGIYGQAGAARMGIARALVQVDPSLYKALKEAGFLTRDSRIVERKKPGQAGARRRFQFSKR